MDSSVLYNDAYLLLGLGSIIMLKSKLFLITEFNTVMIVTLMLLALPVELLNSLALSIIFVITLELHTIL